MPSTIQEQFGDRVIEIFADFARADLKTPADLARDEFSHIGDRELRGILSQVHYGVRWLYKLGLAMLVKDQERAAHIRAQIVDYASIVEALLSYFVAYGIRRGHASGDAYRWEDPDQRRKALTWPPNLIETRIRKRSLWWLARVAREFGIISQDLSSDIDWLRNERNAVHLRERAAVGSVAYLNQSRKAFEIVNKTIRATKLWRGSHH